MMCEVCHKTAKEKGNFIYTHYTEMKKCVICGKNDELIKHHLSYSPPKVIKICRSCHNKIHHSNDLFNNLKPKDKPFYHKNADEVKTDFLNIHGVKTYRKTEFLNGVWLCCDCYTKTTGKGCFERIMGG